MKRGELRLLVHLRNDARKSLSIISRETGIPVTTLFTMLQRLEEEIITKYVSLIDFGRMGFGVRAFMAVKCPEKGRDDVRKFIIGSRNVDSVFRTNDGFDFLFEAVFRNMSELDDFIEGLDDFRLKKLAVHHIIEEYAKEEFLTREGHLDLL